MNKRNRKKAICLLSISILLLVLYMFFGYNLADYMRDSGISPVRSYYEFYYIFLPAISFIWSIVYGYLLGKLKLNDYSFPIFGNPGWVLNLFILPLKMSTRLYSGIITVLFVFVGLRIGAFLKSKFQDNQANSAEAKTRAAD